MTGRRALSAAAAALEPEDGVAVVGFEEEPQLLADVSGALAERRGFFDSAQALELEFEAMERVGEGEIEISAGFEEVFAVKEGHATVAGLAAVPIACALRAAGGGQSGEEQACPLARRLRGSDDAGVQRLLGAEHGFEVTGEFFEADIAEADAEVARGDVFELVRFVEDDDAGFGEDSGIRRGLGLQLDGEIGEEEMVIDDDDIALGGAAAHLGDEAAIVVGAALAEAGVAARIEFGPELAGLGKLVELDSVSGLGGLLPFGDLLILRDFFESVEDGLTAQGVELVPAEIVGAALHIADAQRAEQRLEEGDVLEEELLLQVLGSGRDDDAAARAQGGEQIGEGLAGAGPGLDDQVAVFVEGALDGLCHLQLPAAELVGQLRTRQHAARSEKVIERGQGGHGLGRRGHGGFFGNGPCQDSWRDVEKARSDEEGRGKPIES